MSKFCVIEILSNKVHSPDCSSCMVDSGSGTFDGSLMSPTTSDSFRPLRERTTTTLHLNTKYGDLSPMLPKGHLEPRAHNLPRRRKASDRTVRKVSETTVKGDYTHRRIASTHCTEEQDESCLQELVPNLFVAFADEEGYKQGIPLKGVRGEPFTHFVRISSMRASQDVIEHRVNDNGAQELHLVVSRDPGDDGQTTLVPPQLLTARDFLSQAMPQHYHLQHAPGKYPAVRILITTSNRRAADAMSVAACYLAFESGQATHAVLECLNEEEDILGTWRGIVSRDGIDLVEHIARAQ